ncbi:MAG: hypothetical protein ACR2QE_09090 [Acidimicrobiales bacterium]
MADQRSVDAPIRLLNPLPTLLGRYEFTLAQMLEAGGHCSVCEPVPSIEMPDAAMTDRGRRGVEVARAIRQELGSGDGLIVCVWPAFGLADPVVWGHRGAPPVRIVLHDPVPMRRQFGSGRLAARLGRLAMRSNIDAVVHSSVAADAVRATGWPEPTLARHPMSAPEPRRRGGDGTIAVLGQYKPVRDLDLLGRLGPALRERGLRPTILGRQWPDVPGWDVRDAFVPEAELTDTIARAEAVIVPYTRYYQSGIAIRAAEVAVPVVGRRHPFLADLFGDEWPGLVGGDHVDEWLGAVEGVLAADVAVPVTAYHQRAVADWQQVADG